MRRIESIGFKPERASYEARLATQYRAKAGRGGKRAQTKVKERWRDPVMTEILRPFREGRRQLAMLGDRGLLPISAREYRAYLSTDHWRAFSHSYYQDHGTAKECFVCGSSHCDLHHITYARLGHEQFDDVGPLCRSHHEAVHRVVRLGKDLRTAHIYIRSRYCASTPPVSSP